MGTGSPKAAPEKAGPRAEITCVPEAGKATLNHALRVHVSVFDEYGHRFVRPSVRLLIRNGSDDGISSRMAYLPEHGSKDLGTSTAFIGSDSGYITIDLWGTGVIGDDVLEVEMDGKVIGAMPYGTAAHL